jgi:putative redox protein
MATMTVKLEQQTLTASLASIRNHEVMVDRPVAKEGTDAGPMGGELFLTALGGCFMSNLLAAIRARDLPISRVKTAVVGTLAESPSRFVAVELQVSAQCDSTQCDSVQMLAKVVTIAERGCLVANTLRNAVDLKVTLVDC